jgi:hypothetical protein
VLETQTKGTGANVVPLEKALSGPGSAVPGFGFRKPQAPDDEPPAAREPYRFKLVDVMTQAVLAEDVTAREAVQALEGVRSTVDVLAYVWAPEERRWRLLSFDETRALLDYRDRAAAV